jgi:hypothetical protein
MEPTNSDMDCNNTNETNDTPNDIPNIIMKALDQHSITKWTVYMTGKNTNIVKTFASKQATAFQSALTAIGGQIDSISISNESFRITVNSENQSPLLLSTKSILNVEASVTPPTSPNNHSNTIAIQPTKPESRPFLFHGVIKVPTDIDNETIQEATGTYSTQKRCAQKFECHNTCLQTAWHLLTLLNHKLRDECRFSKRLSRHRQQQITGKSTMHA